MPIFGITGDEGFLGWHLRCRLHAHKEISTLGASRDVMNDEAALTTFVRRSDVVVHLAGMNRGSDEDIETTNVDLTTRLVDACERAAVRPHILFANSTHQERDTPYGRSKRRSAALLGEWANRNGATFTNVIIPNVFGEGGRPFYNSAVSTFCHQLAIGDEPTIIENREIELIHAQNVANHIVACAVERRGGEHRLSGRVATVQAVLDRLRAMNREYRDHVIPSLSDGFDLTLFNTLRSYLFPGYYPVSVERRTDSRGSLFEAVKTLHGGQCFFSSTHPGVTRGNHYHASKIERFMVVHGRARIRVRKLFSSDVTEFLVSGDAPQYIDMPTFHTHNITNVGNDDLMTLFWAHEIFDRERPDTFAELV